MHGRDSSATCILCRVCTPIYMIERLHICCEHAEIICDGHDLIMISSHANDTSYFFDMA